MSVIQTKEAIFLIRLGIDGFGFKTAWLLIS